MANQEIILRYKSTLHTIMNVFDKLSEISKTKQKCILGQKWESLRDVAKSQQEVHKFIESAEKDLEIIGKQDTENLLKNNSELVFLRLRIRDKIEKYREQETINSRLLKDVLYVTREKVKVFLQKEDNGKTYNASLKNDEQIWDDCPMLMDKFV